MVGAWDRIFREQLPGHKHLLQTNTQILNPWDKPAEVFGIQPDTVCLLTVWEMTFGDYPPFHGAAVFPAALFEPPKEEPAPTETDSQTPANPDESEAPAEQTPPADAVSPQTAVSASAEPASEPAPPAEPTQTPSAEPHPVWNAIQQMIQADPAADAPGALDAAVWNCPAQVFMNPKPVWLSPNDSIETARQRMQQHSTRYVLIEEQDKLAGILSRGDVNAAVSPYLRAPFEEYRRPLDEASLQIRIRWFMSRPVHTAQPQTPLWKLIDLMCRHQIRALPIQDSSGTVVGLVTDTEIFQTLLKTRPGGTTAGQTDQKVNG
jgi:CBS domain-containing protein